MQLVLPAKHAKKREKKGKEPVLFGRAVVSGILGGTDCRLGGRYEVVVVGVFGRERR
jgi:hypothetical protein